MNPDSKYDGLHHAPGSGQPARSLLGKGVAELRTYSRVGPQSSTVILKNETRTLRTREWK
jgi:hypothetical protein